MAYYGTHKKHARKAKGLVVKTETYRLYPNKAQRAALHAQMNFACDVYNAALYQRQAWRTNPTRRSLDKNLLFYLDQAKELKDLRADENLWPALPADGKNGRNRRMNMWTVQEVIQRLDTAFAAAVKRHAAYQRVIAANPDDPDVIKPGWPRYKDHARWRSLRWTMAGKAGGFKLLLADNRAQIGGVPGLVRFKAHRALPDDASILLCEVIRGRDGTWHLGIRYETTPLPALPETGQVVGLDLGTKVLAVTSDGVEIPNAKAYARQQKRIAVAQRNMSRKERGSKNRYRERRIVNKRFAQANNARRDQARKLVRRLLDNYDVIALEALDIEQMCRTKRDKDGNRIKNHYAKSNYDAGWGTILYLLTSKAAEAGRSVVLVDPKNTTQDCSGCGQVVPKTIKVRAHDCGHCGLVLDRDHNAAINILLRALTNDRVIRTVGPDRPLDVARKRHAQSST